MNARYPYVLLPREAAQRIKNADINSGTVTLRHAASENIYVPRSIMVSESTSVDAKPPREFTALNWESSETHGQWVRMRGSGINLAHLDTLRRGLDVATPFEAFKTVVPSVIDPGAMTGLMITYDPDIPQPWREAGASEFSAWLIQRSAVRPIPLAVEPEWGLSQLTGVWPIEKIAQFSIMVVGVGSIGGAIAQALAAYGVGTVKLVDPDRFLWHNMIRHVLGPESVGRHKVDAMKAHLALKWPHTRVEPHQLDVVDDTHILRPLLKGTDLIVCAADGIAARRVVSHLARRAGKPAMLACVLDDGAVAEIVRLLPTPRFGCLLCLRAHLREAGAMDVEATQELEYGTGFVHRPMTAVGPDLHLVGQLAAKASVATLLESRLGDHTQSLPDNLATIGLRPPGDMAAPFDLTRALQITWRSIPPPRADCLTCNR